MPIDKIKHSDITTALKKGLWTSGKTRNNQLSIISSVFNLAVSDDIIPKNPCENIDAAVAKKEARSVHDGRGDGNTATHGEGIP